MKQTTNFHLNKPDTTDYYNIQDSNNNMDIIDAEIKEAQDKADQAFQSASNGKAAIKTAITGVDPTVTIPTDATFNQLAAAIGQIKTGVDTGDATATAAQILASMTAYVKGTKVTGTMTNNGPTTAETINLTAQNQEYTIISGFHSGLRKIKAVIINLTAGVIKAGVTVGGIVGNFTSDATATAAQIFSGAIAYVNGNKITGTMPVHTATENATQYSPGSTGVVYVYVPAGYHDGSHVLQLIDSKYLASNILNTASIFGLQGTAIAGKRFASGTVTSSSTTVSTFGYLYGYAISNNFFTISVSGLAFKPTTIYLFCTVSPTLFYYIIYKEDARLYYPKTVMVFQGTDGPVQNYNYTFKGDVGSASVFDGGFTLPALGGNTTYNWVAYE